VAALPGIEIDRSLPSLKVIVAIKTSLRGLGKPKTIRRNNRLEYIG